MYQRGESSGRRVWLSSQYAIATPEGGMEETQPVVGSPRQFSAVSRFRRVVQTGYVEWPSYGTELSSNTPSAGSTATIASSSVTRVSPGMTPSPPGVISDKPEASNSARRQNRSDFTVYTEHEVERTALKPENCTILCGLSRRTMHRRIAKMRPLSVGQPSPK